MQLRFDPVTTSDRQHLRAFLAAHAWPFHPQPDVNERWLRGASERGDFFEDARSFWIYAAADEPLGIARVLREEAEVP